jgi:protein SCO1/2
MRGLSILAFMVAAAIAPAASAHSLKDLDHELFSKEKFFQPVDIAAPGFSLKDADGRTFSLSDFHGKVVVLNFIYTNCPDACPLQAEKIAGIQKIINQTPMKDLVSFVTITTDPKRDYGQVLSDYGRAHGLDSANWVFLTAGPDQPEDATRKLARAYGLEFTPDSDGLETHGVVTHVIDQSGRMLARFHGLEFDSTNLILFVNALTNHLQDHHHDADQGLWPWLKGFF